MLCQLLARTSRTAGGRVVGVGVTPCSCTRAASFSSLPSSSGSSSSSSSSIRTSPRKGNIPSTNIVLSPSLLRHFARISVSSPSSSFSTNAREATPPPPPPPPPPSSSFSSSSVLPSNLYLADASVLTRYKPVPLETLIQRKEQMEGIIDPAALTLPVRRALGAGVGGEEEEEQMSLDARVFGVPVRKDIIHRVVTWQRAKKRLGLASTKRVGDIRGSTKKLRPQKGSGRARAGKKHAAQFRGGMKAHGPVQRDFSFKLNKKVRALGVRMALSAKAREGGRRGMDLLLLFQGLEKILRSLNNLEARLYHGFFLYLMPSRDHFVSLSEYIYAMVLLLLPFLPRFLTFSVRAGYTSLPFVFSSFLLLLCWSGGLYSFLLFEGGREEGKEERSSRSCLLIPSILLLFFFSATLSLRLFLSLFPTSSSSSSSPSSSSSSSSSSFSSSSSSSSRRAGLGALLCIWIMYSQLALTFLNYSLAVLLSLPLLLFTFLLPSPSFPSSSPSPSPSSSSSRVLRQRLAIVFLLLLLYFLPFFLPPALPRLLLLNHLLYFDVHVPWFCFVIFPCLALLTVLAWAGGREGGTEGRREDQQ
ncbi:hypothetical protein VYU27_006713 [Nannochloropsis oceanica]